MGLQITQWSDQGPRSAQEDRQVMTYHNGTYVAAIMDGHSGSECVDLVEKYLSTWGTYGWIELFPALHELTKNCSSGCAITVLVITGDRCSAAILGDSPIAWRQHGHWQLGPTHNVLENPAEVEAALKRDLKAMKYQSWVCVESGEGLAMTRALGDCKLDSFLNREPEIVEFDLAEVDTIILATDGALDQIHGSKGDSILNGWGQILDMNPNAKAKDLVEWRKKYEPLKDNCSVTLIKCGG